MSLAHDLEQLLQQMMDGMSGSDQETVSHAMSELLASNYGKNALQPGDKAPDFTLTQVGGGEFNLYAALQQGPIVLSFIRGGWCPFCNLEVKALLDVAPEIQAHGATLVMLSPEVGPNALETQQSLDIHFPLLMDDHNLIAKQYGVLNEVLPAMRPLYQAWGIDLTKANGYDSYELPIPATYIISRDRQIVNAQVNLNYTQRMEPSEIIAALSRSFQSPHIK